MRFDLEALSEPSSLLQISLDAIDEDPDQPRQEFDPVALGELAETIRARGVLQPVSVRRHATAPARYVLNFGARRLRASRLASKTAIPAFIDDLATSYDQVVENEQRESLTPLELALFVERRLGAGDSQAEIARRLGKSRPYVTYATALIDAPDWLLGLYRQGRCRGLLELYELRQLHAKAPDSVRRLESGEEPITRQRIAEAKATVAIHSPNRTRAEVGQVVACGSERSRSRPARHTVVMPSRSRTHEDAGPSSTGSRGHYALLAELQGRTVEVVVDEVPSAPGRLFVTTPGATDRRAVAAGELRLLGLAARAACSAV